MFMLQILVGLTMFILPESLGLLLTVSLGKSRISTIEGTDRHGNF